MSTSLARSSADDARELERLYRFLTRPGPRFGLALALYADAGLAREYRDELVERIEDLIDAGPVEIVEIGHDEVGVDLFERIVAASGRAPLVFVVGLAQLLVDAFGRPRRSVAIANLNHKRDKLPAAVTARVVFWLPEPLYPQLTDAAWDLCQVMLTTAEFRQTKAVRVELSSRATPAWFERASPDERDSLRVRLREMETILADTSSALTESDAAASASSYAFRLGEVARGVALLRRAAEAAERGGEALEASRARRRLAEVHLLERQFADALAEALRALELVEGSPLEIHGPELIRREAAVCAVLLAEIESQLGYVDAALDRLAASLEALLPGEDVHVRGLVWAKTADIHERAGNFADAVEMRTTGQLAEFSAAGAEREIAETWLNLAQTHARAGELGEAISALQEDLSALDPAQHRRAHELHLRLLEARGDDEGAVALRVLLALEGPDQKGELGEALVEALALVVAGLDGSARGRPASAEELERLTQAAITFVLRLVAMLFLEDRGLVPVDHPSYRQRLGVLALYEELRAGAGRLVASPSEPDGAYVRLARVFATTYAGGRCAELELPARGGALFDPQTDAVLLEFGALSLRDERIFAILDKLLMLRGERLNYRALGIEQLGSTLALCRRYRIRPRPEAGAGELMLEDDPRPSLQVTTPRSLAEPLVRRALEPVLERLGPDPGSERLLSLKICDPAMGGGALLIEACRILADQLVDAWVREKRLPELPDASPFGEARRLVAASCIYGVDVDPLAVDLSRFSLGLLSANTHGRLDPADAHLRCGDSLLGDVFDGGLGSFDVVVTQSPMLGGRVIGERLGVDYRDRLRERYPSATGHTDLAVFFLRRSLELVRDGGSIGFIGPNTLSEGSNRDAGLALAVREGAHIYAAKPNLAWPTVPGTVVTTVHLSKGGAPPDEALLGDERVPTINSHLQPFPELGEPQRLAANLGAIFMGTSVMGEGFVLSPDEGEALLAANPTHAEILRPYVSGKDVALAYVPARRSTRYVIDFGDRSHAEASQWPELLAIVEQRVKPIRTASRRRDALTERWWTFARPARELYAALESKARWLVVPRVARFWCVAIWTTPAVFADSTFVIADDSFALFACLQSRVHWAWAEMLGTHLGRSLRYSSACFETFPLPPAELRGENSALATAGAELEQLRLAYAKGGGSLGHPEAPEPELRHLHALHLELERRVLAAYGWSDLAVPEFFEPQTTAERRQLREFESELRIRLAQLNLERTARE